jgi:hypothetical protein
MPQLRVLRNKGSVSVKPIALTGGQMSELLAASHPLPATASLFDLRQTGAAPSL